MWKSVIYNKWNFVQMLFLIVALSVLSQQCTCHVFPVPEGENEVEKEYWQRLNDENLQERLAQIQNKQLAKNVIIFIGDGMGISTITAARIYKGQRNGRSGEESNLSFDKFPHVSLSKTYAVDRQTPDSASTATAYLCGCKANLGTLGVTAAVERGDCEKAAASEFQVDSIMSWAQKNDRWTGIVTTERVTDATPAAAYAHAADRRYEAKVPKSCSAKDIARQLIEDSPGKNFRVILGGGRRNFLPSNQRGSRQDGRNLIREWLSQRMSLNQSAAFLVNRQQLLQFSDEPQITHLFGLFADEYMPYKFAADETMPTLQEMTSAALNVLEKAPSGFVLLVEGAKIDTAHHENKPAFALEEAFELDRAVLEATRRRKNDTLVVVTADHSHAFTIAGYPKRGNSILGMAGSSSKKRQYPTLSYAVGPGGIFAERDFSSPAEPPYMSAATFAARSGSHGGEDVAVFAMGPWAHLFSGVHDQTFIPHVIRYAACLNDQHENEEDLPKHCYQHRSHRRHRHSLS